LLAGAAAAPLLPAPLLELAAPVGAAAAPLLPAPLLELAAPVEPLTLNGLRYIDDSLGIAGTYGGIQRSDWPGRLSEPRFGGGVLTLEVVRRCQAHWEKVYR